MRRAVVLVFLVTLAAASVGAVSAQEPVTVTASGPVNAGEAVTVVCPEGHEFESGAASFYRREGAKRPLAVVALTEDADYEQGFASAPKGSRFYTAEATCSPIPPA